MACHAQKKPSFKGSCAVGPVERSCMCVPLVRTERFLSLCGATTNASSEENAERRGRAIALDAQVEQRFLQARPPDQVTLALAALAHVEQEERAERNHWEWRLERVRSETK